MNLLEKFSQIKESFINKELANAVKSLLVLEQQYVDKKQGKVLAGTLLSLSHVFKEDANSINKILASESSVRIQRNIGENSSITPVKLINKGEKKQTNINGCPTCPKTGFVAPKMAAKLEANMYAVPESLEDLKGVKTWRDVANMFGASDSAALIAFCKLNGITVGNTKKEDLLIKKIFDAVRNESNTNR